MTTYTEYGALSRPTRKLRHTPSDDEEIIIGKFSNVPASMFIAAGFDANWLAGATKKQAGRVRQRLAWYIERHDASFLYCEKHARIECKKLLIDDPEGGYKISATAWEEDSVCHCETCGVLLGRGQSLTDYGARQEIEHYTTRPIDEISRSPYACWCLSLAIDGCSQKNNLAILAVRLAWWRMYHERITPKTRVALMIRK